MDIKTSKKRPWTPSFLSLSNSFCQGIQSKAFLKSTKHEKSKFRCFCGLDFTNLSISQGHPTNICLEDDLRSRIFGTFVVKFLACLPLIEFSNI